MLRDNRSFPHLRSRPGPLSTFSTGSSSVYSQWNALRYATRVSSFSTQFNLHQLLKCLKTGEPLRVFSHLYWIITTCSKKQVMDANIIESPKYNALSACLWTMLLSKYEDSNYLQKNSPQYISNSKEERKANDRTGWTEELELSLY